MITEKQKQFIEYKAKETLRSNLYKITHKYNKLKDENNYLLEKKQEREVKRAYNKAELRKKNQYRKAEGKVVKEKPVNRVKKCDEARSRYMRNKYKECYTCGGNQSLGCGHRISRKIRKLRRDERNTRVQCFYKCNAKFSGNGMPVEFRYKLKSEGIDVETLELIALGDNKKPTEKELIQIYSTIKKQLGE